MYKFDAQLIPHVLADQTFQKTGIYLGQDGPLVYSVIDPRRHNIDVWRKHLLPRGYFRDPISHLTYELSAIELGAHWFTNGPQMDPPRGPGKFNQFLGYVFGSTWIPFGPIIHRSRVIDAGKPLSQQFFGRIGQGRFTHYKIGDDPPLHGYIEACGGMVQLVKNGGVVTNQFTLNMQAAVGVSTWGLRPINPPVDTTGWETGYLDRHDARLFREPGMTREEFEKLTHVDRTLPAWMLDGVLVSASSNQMGVNPVITSQMMLVGCTDVVAADGSDSALAGAGRSVFVPCQWHKDKIQRYGLACR